jgi:tetratricopeptide (TPR) repeat protein
MAGWRATAVPAPRRGFAAPLSLLRPFLVDGTWGANDTPRCLTERRREVIPPVKYGISVRARSARFAIALVVFLELLAPVLGVAQAPAGPVARAASVQGRVEARRAGQTQWQPVGLNDTFSPGDVIRVGERSRADIAMLDQSVLRLNANTETTVEAVKGDRTSVVNLLRGAAHFFSRGPRSLEVQTPFTIAGVRGTEFFIGLEPDRALLTVFEGTVLAESQAGSLTLTSGQSAVAETGKAPVLRVVARPRDAVQWTLHYPPVLYFRPDEFPSGPGWQGMVRRSLDASAKGDLAGAFDAIATVPPTIADPRFFAYRAHLLLAVGRVDEAAADIERARRLAPNDADALALQTIIAVAQGARDRALETAQRAVLAAPGSATAHLALSYAQQARFDLDGARKTVENAVALDPNNALAWARLSELWASFGELDRALRAAQRAAVLEPDLSRTQTVLGYAHLMRVQTRQATEAFEKAIRLDQADPLPRLGLGLTKIREGKLHDGGREIEVAASLDPANAIVRSYLGKTYYEEKRTGLDQREYSMAKELDPLDPTPYFYGAIAKQTTNRPVEALQDMQRAIELNDNRAVYRSRMLLDADEAARSASLGRIYSDLGFEQLALVEGWKSVNTDSTNFSAHRLLADSYAAQPRHGIARVSELLQSQLLQPLNTTPIQPRLAESNLFLISAGGPGALSFNEFNPIFNRNGVTLQATGLAGSNDTWAGEGVLGGIYQKVSFSLGYTYFDTDGWRVNAGQQDRIGNAFVQVELTPQTSIQAEFRHREREIGDLQLRFFTEDVLPNLKETEERSTYRVGLRHAFTPGSIVLASFIYQHADIRSHDASNDGFVTAFDQHVPDLRSIGGEAQYLFRSRAVNLVAGGGHVDLEAEQTVTIEFIVPPSFSETTVEDSKHTNAYVYSYLNFVKGLTLTLGLSADFFRTRSANSEDRDQFNPKLGITWNPFRDTTIRAAAFRVLTRTLINDQTIEPTQVAGFNQFFDDAGATESWRYGVAVDQKFSRTVFGGVEASRRDLKIPFRSIVIDGVGNVVTDTVERGDAREDLARAYLFWTPHPWVALSAEYQYERFKHDDEVAFFFKELTTHRLPLGVRFFHPSGFGASLRTTFHHQEGEFRRLTGFCCESGTDDFWLVDAAVSYRLPKRFGLVTVGATNLLDKRFRYQETDLTNPSIQPDRFVFTKLTLSF